MSEKEFNLLHEPCILVMKPNGETEEVSVLDAFRRASEFQSLAGELPTQDVAVLRLLLAILHVVFARYDEKGNLKPLASPFDALDRWKALWENGAFPMKVIEDYLLSYEERFYLFHPDRPFYQVAGLGEATEYPAAKLNGELSESNNKIRLFPQRTGKSKEGLQYSEAFRWLLYLNAFDDTSAKPKKKGLPSPGAGWVGKLGLVIAVGNSLFETLMLNLILLKDGANELWGEEKPTWEARVAKSDERTEIIIPDNLAELYTIQSRRLLLKHQEEVVDGYSLLGGDFFPKENAFTEQMTVWRYGKSVDDNVEKYRPRRHDPARQFWRDFPAMVVQAEGKRRPGIVNWLARLKSEGLAPYGQFRFMTVAVHYADKDFFVDDVFTDELYMNAQLLTSLGENWVSRIISELETTELLVSKLGILSEDLAKAAGYVNPEAQKTSVKEQSFFRLDEPFRQWLEEIDPENEENSKDEICEKWWNQAQRIIREIGKELVGGAGQKAFIGREIIEKINKKDEKRLYTAPIAYNAFLRRTATRQTLRGEYKHG